MNFNFNYVNKTWLQKVGQQAVHPELRIRHSLKTHMKMAK